MKRLAKLGFSSLLLLLVAGVSCLAFFVQEEEPTTVGPFQATVTPAFDHHVTLDGGALMPSLRMESPSLLGVRIELEGLEEGDLSSAFAAAGVLAADASGEQANVQDAVKTMALRSALFGLFVALFVYGVSALLLRFLTGLPLTAHVARLYSQTPPVKKFVSLGVAIFLALPPLVMVQQSSERLDADRSWIMLREAFPVLPDEEGLRTLQIENSPLTDEVKTLIQGALRSYEDSLAFYGKLAETASRVQLRQPLTGESTALIVTDRHDNISMDKVARVLGDSVNAKLLLDLGDDTSSGGEWEKFSINSLAETFSDYTIVAVGGNHDNGGFIGEAMENKGITVLKGEIVEAEGLRILGAPDPRATTFGRGYEGPAAAAARSISELDEALTATACEAYGGEESVQLVLVHSSAASKELVKSGCAPLVLSGHLHRQVGPLVQQGEREPVTSLTTGTTGGAAYAFALGSKLRRDAQVSILTYDETGPLGLQVIDLTTGGAVTAQPYYSLSQLDDSIATPGATGVVDEFKQRSRMGPSAG